jgi:hypothetical protein
LPVIPDNFPVYSESLETYAASLLSTADNEETYAENSPVYSESLETYSASLPSTAEN